MSATPDSLPDQRATRRLRPDLATAGPAAVTLAVMVWGIGAPSYWRDEADTVSAVSRSLPQLIRLLRHVDAVHGLYYLLLWPVARLAGTGALATRLPSALAMAAADFGVAALARRLGNRRAAVCAGLIFAVLPMASAQGHDARPYAMVTAAAVLSSYLLIRAAGDPRARWFTGYALSLALLGYLHLFALLLVPAHAITFAALTGGRTPGRRLPGLPPGPLARRWLAATTAAGVAVAPLVVLGWLQRAQIGWIQRPGWSAAEQVVTSLAAYSLGSAALFALLIARGAARGAAVPATHGATGRRALAWLALPWLLLPPITLFLVSEIKPVYYILYLTFCLPAVALLSGAGLASLTVPTRAAAAAAAAALALPPLLAMRAPGSGGSIRPAAQVLKANERHGDAIIYPGSGIPPWYLAYPNGFGQLRAISESRSGPSSGRLYGLPVPLPVLLRRERGVCRIWAAELGPAWHDPRRDLLPEFRLVRTWRPGPGRLQLWLYRRPGCRAAGTAAAGSTGAAASASGVIR